MTDPITVLHLLPTGGVGGQEQYVASLCRRMRRVMPEVVNKVCFSMSGGEIADRIREEGTPTFILELSSGYDLIKSLKLLSLVKREKVDVIHSHGPLPVLNLMARFSGASAQVLTDHGPTLGSQVKREWRRAFFLRLAPKAVNKYIAISRSMAETLVKRERIPRDAITIIYNGVDVDALRGACRSLEGGPHPDGLPFEPGTPLIGTVSRLVTDKRIHLFLEVCAAIAAKNDAVRFVIAGDGPLRDDMEKRAGELGLTGRVHFLGRRKDVPDLLGIMDLYLCTSMGEAFSIALLEAMALSCPIAAFDVEGVQEAVFPDKTGFLVEDGDVNGLAEACLTILNDPEMRRKMGEESLSIVKQRFDLDENIRRLGGLYRELLAQKKR